MSYWLWELTSCVEVGRPILLYSRNVKAKQVWSTYYIPLKLHVERGLSLVMVIDVRNCDSYLLFSLRMNYEPRSHFTMVYSGNSIGHLPGPNKVDIVILLPCFDNSGHKLFSQGLLKGIAWLPHSQRFEEHFIIRIRTFTVVKIPQSSSIHLNSWLKLSK